MYYGNIFRMAAGRLIVWRRVIVADTVGRRQVHERNEKYYYTYIYMTIDIV